MKLFRNLFAVLCVALLFASCEKTVMDFGDVQKITPETPLIKINYASPYKDDRFVIVKFNNQRVTSIIQNRTPFPGGGLNTRGDLRADYLTVAPGNVELKIARPFKIDNGLDSLVIHTSNFTIEKGKKYVIHITDTAQLTKTVLTEERFKMPDSAFAEYRFINLMPNVPALDLYYGQSATVHTADRLIASNIGFLKISDYILLNRASARTWKIRAAGAAITSAPIASYTSVSALLNQRTYTIYANGYLGGTTGNAPFVSLFFIR